MENMPYFKSTADLVRQVCDEQNEILRKENYLSGKDVWNELIKKLFLEDEL